MIPTHAFFTRRAIKRAGALLGTLSALALGAAEPAFRTDGGDDKLPWFELKPREFPPEGSAHVIAGELIALDHINRTGVLRPDRTDAQRRGDWDIPLPFVLLPFGTIRYHGAPAELRDIPIGTHLHGLFYQTPPLSGPKSPTKKAVGEEPRMSFEAAFSRVLQFEDDFSFFARQRWIWRVEGIDLLSGTLTVVATGAAKNPVGVKPTQFVVGPATRIWKEGAVGAPTDLVVGQNVLLNLTVCTLKGPGRCIDIWLDDRSRDAATAHQRELHRLYQREHGLAGQIDEVDNQQGIVTVTLFAGFDPKLKEDFAVNDIITATVAKDSLRTWDQINDKKSGSLLEIQGVQASPGRSDFRLKFKPSLLLEGFRPKQIIRVFSAKWKVDDLPREERLY